MRSSVGRQSSANEAIQQHQWEPQKPIDNKHFLSIVLTACTELALDLTLVTAIVRNVKKKSADKHG